MITPESIAKESEHSHQAALFSWAAMNQHNAPELAFMFAIPNGGDRHIITAGKLKAEGVKAGTVDIFLPVPRPTQFSVPTSVWYHGFFIEMKKPSVKLKRGPNGPGPWDYGGVSDDQKKFLDFAVGQGYMCGVYYDWTTAAVAIVKYLTGETIRMGQ